MKDEMEKIIVESIVEGVMKSSTLPSSLAVRLMKDPLFVSGVTERIDADVLIDKIASEYVRLASQGTVANRWVSVTNIERRIAEMTFEKMSRELEIV